MKKNLLVIISLILVGVVSRLIPHWPNFTPVLAGALFAGAYISDKKWAYMAPLAIMFISDLFLPWHATMPFVYGTMALMVFVGTFIKKARITNITLISIAGSVLFFGITNLGEWITDVGNIYANDLSGLAACYAAALPFAANQWLPGPLSFTANPLFADLIYNGVLFGGYALAQHYIPALKPATVKA